MSTRNLEQSWDVRTLPVTQTFPVHDPDWETYTSGWIEVYRIATRANPHCKAK